MKRPAFQFYPNDWMSDKGLRMCSLAARGLWMDMMCLMHQATPYGYLMFKDQPMKVGQLARLVGDSQRNTEKYLDELKANDVCSTDADGVIYSRRMVRDENIREVRAKGGLLGADHGGKGGLFGSKGGRPVIHKAGKQPALPPQERQDKGPEKPPLTSEKGGYEPPIKPPPSSSSSSSIYPPTPLPVDNSERAKSEFGNDDGASDWPPPDMAVANAILEQHGKRPSTRPHAIAKFLQERGFMAQSVQPHVMQWGKDPRVTNFILETAVQDLRLRQPGGRVNSTQLCPWVAAALAQQHPGVLADLLPLWGSDDLQMHQMGNSLGLWPNPYESPEQYRKRLALTLTKQMEAA